jgi:hypothetical protein
MKRKMLLILGSAALIVTGLFAFKPSAKFTSYSYYVGTTCTALTATCTTNPSSGILCVAGVTNYYPTTNCMGTPVILYQP